MPTSVDGGNAVSSPLHKSLEERLAFLEGRITELSTRLADDGERNLSSPTTTDKAAVNGILDTKDTDSTSAVRVVNSIWDSERNERRDVEPSQPIDGSAAKDHSCLLRKKFHERRPTGGEIEIYDVHLLALLGKLLPDHWRRYFVGKTVILQSPYIPLIHNWDALVSASGESGADEDETHARNVLQKLLTTINNGSGDPKVDSYLKGRDSLKQQESITYDHLWALFSPGDLVYGQIFQNQHQLFIFEEETRRPINEEDSENPPRPEVFLMKCWTYDFTGKEFRRKAINLPIPAFHGVKDIASLPYRPWYSIPESERGEIEKELLRRGRLFRKYCIAGERDDERENGRMHRYTGDASVDNYGMRGIQSTDDRALERMIHLRRLSREYGGFLTGAPQKNLPVSKSDVIIDFASYILHGPDWVQIGAFRLTDGANNSAKHKLFKPHYDGAGLSASEEWEDLQTQLCPPRVLAYLLKEKCWAQLLVDNLEDADKKGEKEVMEEGGLYLEGERGGQETKQLLLSLVKKHDLGAIRTNDKTYEFHDIVPEKGKGLVILLYGVPGTGKTSTAQMVARATRKPLFSIGVADIGVRANEVESNLETIFTLATKWRAILLIDEADVYLQNRSFGHSPSPEKSALVSVFMRVLEYYRGVLFLTTNQIAQFDVAVQSRINVAKKYNKLTKEQTKKIFAYNLQQYQDKGLVEVDSRLKEYGDMDLWEEELDGRQIRNLVTTSIGHAVGMGKQRMELRDIKDVMHFVRAFKRDLDAQMYDWEKAQKGTSLNK